MKIMRCLALLTLLVFTAPAYAEEAKLISEHRDWAAYALTEGGGKVCYMASKPTASEPKGAKRGDIYAMITHRPAEKSYGVVSFVVGYTYKKDSEASVTIGNQRFSLFTDGDTAWAYDDATDKALAAAIRSGDKMILTGTSARGTQTTDTFSLTGTGAAYKAIGTACGVK
jgi:invasion protein IalB